MRRGKQSSVCLAARHDGRDRIPELFLTDVVGFAIPGRLGDSAMSSGTWRCGRSLESWAMFTVAGDCRNEGADSARPSTNLQLNNPTS